MLAFEAVRSGEMTIAELLAGLGVVELRRLTNEMVDTILTLIADCMDADVVFTPVDPEAHDPDAEDEVDIDLAWTLGHIIVHVTASAEEAAAIAAELARGVPHRGGRSRSEVPWQTVTTIAQCRQRLEESRRMRLASLEMWPDNPDLENGYETSQGEHINAVRRFVGGLAHDQAHLGQIEEVVRQAVNGRS